MQIAAYSRMQESLMLLAIAIVAILIYSNTFNSAFTLDDVRNIKLNPHIRLTELSLQGFKQAAFRSSTINRQVANISFALNYYFHEYDVRGYHLVNSLIHIITGILLYFFVKATVLEVQGLRPKTQNVETSSNSPVSPDSQNYVLMPAFAAFVWLVHPIQTQSVTYIVQRMNSLMAMFYIMSFLFYIKARLADNRRKKLLLFTGCVLTGILSVSAKELGVTLPLFILLYEWFFFQDLNFAWLKRYVLFWGSLVVLLTFAAVMYFKGLHHGGMFPSYDDYDFNMIQRVLTEFRVVVFYLSLLFLPHPSRLNLEHDFAISHSLADPVSTLFSMFVIIGLFVLALYLIKKERLLSFCILWFLGNLVIESSVIALELIYEHRLYLPSMGITFLTAILLTRLFKLAWLKIVLISAVLLVFSFWTYERNKVWKDGITLWTDCVEKSPDKFRPHNNLGIAYKHKGKYEKAVRHFARALEIKPDDAGVHNNMGNTLARQRKLDKAIFHYNEALRIDPDNAVVYLIHNNLGLTLARKDRIKEAVYHFKRAVEIKPDYEKAQKNLQKGLEELRSEEKES